MIFDEVFCGLWRLGVESSRELLGEDPDVSCYAKLLTGGLVPMAATVATERVFDAFSGAKVTLQSWLYLRPGVLVRFSFDCGARRKRKPV